MITLDEFLVLPVEEVTSLVCSAGQHVCVFPINGTRRWFLLEYGNRHFEDPLGAYIEFSAARHISLYKLIFDHGIDTLLTPILGPDILKRGDEYMARVGGEGMQRLACGPDFLQFYADHDVRVHFYGDYRRELAGTPLATLPDLFDEVTDKTRHHHRFRLFFGVFAHDATRAVAEFTVRYHQQHGNIPDRRQIVEMYYGEYIEPASFFIGFDRFSAFDYPLLGSGKEDLYFTVAPSPYLNERTLRLILYDHLYTRRFPDPDCLALSPEKVQELDRHYLEHRERVLGVGTLRSGFWDPLTE